MHETSTNITDICTCLIPTTMQKMKNFGKSEFWEKKTLDNKSLIIHFSV